MYLVKQKLQAPQKKVQSEQIETSPKMEANDKTGAGPDYEDVRIHYSSRADKADKGESAAFHPELVAGADEQNAVVQRSPISVDMIMSLAKQGMSFAVIAAMIGIPVLTVYKLISWCMTREGNQSDDHQAGGETFDAGANIEQLVKNDTDEDTEGKKPVDGKELPQEKHQQEEKADEASPEKPQQEAGIEEVLTEDSQEENQIQLQQELLRQRFERLDTRIKDTFTVDEMKAPNPAPAIKLWRGLKHKCDNASLTEDDLNKLEGAIPRKRRTGRTPVQEMQPESSQALAEENPKDAEAVRWLGEPDAEHSYDSTPCKKGSMLIQFLTEKEIISPGEHVCIGHQSGRTKDAKRFVAVIRGRQYLIFMAQHPGENFKEYVVRECYITPDKGYGIDLAGKRIFLSKDGIILEDRRKI